MVSKGNHPQMAELFSLVNYYNLPRCWNMLSFWLWEHEILCHLGARLSDIPTETGLINEFWLRWFWHWPLKLWSQFSTKYEAVCLSAWPHACSSLVVTDVPRVASCTTVTRKHLIMICNYVLTHACCKICWLIILLFHEHQKNDIFAEQTSGCRWTCPGAFLLDLQGEPGVWRVMEHVYMIYLQNRA